MKITLPYPPSVNTYWGFCGSRRFLTKKAVEFKKAVAEAFTGTGFATDRLQITIWLYPPDRRKSDIDNRIKSCLDAIVQAGFMTDDSQVDRLIVSRETVRAGGMCIVELQSIQG